VFLNLFSQLDQLNSRYNTLSNSIYRVENSVYSQIGSITDRVEQVLKAQNNLTADYSTQVKGADLAANTVTFSLRAVPKTYTEGMEVLFLADSGDGPIQIGGERGADGAYTAEVTCALTDSITLSAVFVTGDTQQTQLLYNYYDLYSGSFPEVELTDFAPFLNAEPGKDGRYATDSISYVSCGPASWASVENEAVGQADVQSVQVGLFCNQTLVCWLEPCDYPFDSGTAEDGEQYFALDPVDLALEEGDFLCFAARVTDEYGRERMVLSTPPYSVENGQLTWTDGEFPVDYTSSPEEWNF
jgi:hypothetical protein